jgi:excisionase family DNA binding protein
MAGTGAFAFRRECAARKSEGDQQVKTISQKGNEMSVAEREGKEVAERAESLLLTDTEVGRLLSVSRRTIWRLVSSGDLPSPIRMPGLRAARWRREDIEEAIASCKPAR